MDEPEARQIHKVFHNLPLFDNTSLNMQAMNIGLVDAHLENLETALLAEYQKIEKTPLISAMLVSALSQMWIFGVYELLRTWRQEARELIAYADELVKLSGKMRVERIAKEKERIAKVEVSHRFGTAHYSRHFVRAATDNKFIPELRDAYSRVDGPFRRVELLRVTLAKHEIPKAGGIRAETPGYARIDMLNGSMYWDITHKDNTSEVISRRDLADACREIGDSS